MATLKYAGREMPFITGGTFQESADIEIESGIPAETMTSSHKGAMAVLISLRRAGIVMSWADVMNLDGDDFEVIQDPAPDPTEAAPARVPQDRKPRKATARRGAAAGGSRAG